MRNWQLQEAKNKFSQVVDEAIKGDPQIITRHGNSVAVVLSYEEFLKLRAKREPLSKFFGSISLEGVFLERDKSGLRTIDDLSS